MAFFGIVSFLNQAPRLAELSTAHEDNFYEK